MRSQGSYEVVTYSFL